MKKILLLAVIFGVLITTAFSTELGGGISVFIPESLYRYGDGSISFDKELSTSFGINTFLSLPVGINYNSIYGLMVEGDSRATRPWFYADSLMAYLMLKAKLPLGMFYLEAYGGGAVNYNISLKALIGNIQKDLASGGSEVAFNSPKFENNLGWGYLAGAAFGIKVDKISVDLNGTYRNIWHTLNMSGDYTVLGSGSVAYDKNITLLLRGFSVGISGTFAF